MLKIAFAAAALGALMAAPASAASMAGCSGANLTKAGTMAEQMADGPMRMEAFHEISAAQDDLLAGKMGSCAKHLGKAMKAGAMKPPGSM